MVGGHRPEKLPDPGRSTRCRFRTGGRHGTGPGSVCVGVPDNRAEYLSLLSGIIARSGR